jgi:hypothetical protein
MARRVTVALVAALCAAPVPLWAQRDVGPVRLALFGGARVSSPAASLAGLAGELELGGIWSLAAAATYVGVSGGSYARYELDGRWHPSREGRLRPYLGVGLAIARSAAAVGGPSETHVGGLGFAGVDVPVFHTTPFIEVVGVETGSFFVEVRGGLRLLVFGR